MKNHYENGFMSLALDQPNGCNNTVDDNGLSSLDS